MQRQRGELVPVAEVLSDLGGLVPGARERGPAGRFRPHRG